MDIKAKIIAAADELASAGIKVTMDAVRKKLGGKGSCSTLSATLREWKEARRAAEAARAAIEFAIPVELSDRSMQHFTDIWRMARIAADNRLAGERKIFEEKILELEAERSEAIKDSDQIMTELENTTIALDEIKTRLQIIQAERDLALQHKIQAETRAEEADKRLCDMNVQLERLDRHITELSSQNCELVKALAKNGDEIPPGE